MVLQNKWEMGTHYCQCFMCQYNKKQRQTTGIWLCTDMYVITKQNLNEQLSTVIFTYHTCYFFLFKTDSLQNSWASVEQHSLNSLDTCPSAIAGLQHCFILHSLLVQNPYLYISLIFRPIFQMSPQSWPSRRTRKPSSPLFLIILSSWLFFFAPGNTENHDKPLLTTSPDILLKVDQQLFISVRKLPAGSWPLN